MSVTIREVAKLAGVSIKTVSRVINNSPEVKDETRLRVIKVIEKLNYYPNSLARGLVKKQTNTLGMIIPREAEYVFSDPFFPEIIRAIDNVINTHNFSLNISTANTKQQEEASYNQLLRSKRVEGIFLICPRLYDSMILRLEKEGFPFVVIGKYLEAKKARYYVDSDNVLGAFKGVEHLINLGDSEIAFINGPLKFVVSHDRLEGYKQALKKHNLKFKKDVVIEADYSQEGGYEAMKKLLAKSHIPTALFAANDLMAIGAMRAIKAKGLKIPDDIAVVGFDDKEFSSWVEPPLTTVRQSVYEIGSQAAQMLIKIVRGEKVERTEILLPTKLVIRQSCGCSE